MFKRADKSVGDMNGINAWRRIVRHIDHGRDRRLKDLRHEMQLIHLRPIKTLPEVEQGVAAFENSIHEFVQAGGVAPSDKEMKDHLLRILPGKMQLDLRWHATKEDIGFSEFRDHIVSQSALVMNVQRPHNRGIHQMGVANEQPDIPAKMPRT